MFQKWIGIGRITADPELKHTPTGTPVTRFTLAVDRGFKDESREKQADFIDIVVWREQAENCVKYLSKGVPAAVEGRLQIRSYEDSQGIRRKAAEVIASRVVFLPNGKKGDTSGGIEPPPWPEDEPGGASFGGDDINLDGIPF